ncbi:MAG TPA: hypothetical protein VE779_05300 [Candidatus Angelobacter sp.]|jgi:hypothetical protein|nr:hypothetical protein [Candidatus Angelobacter sp.]
MGRIAALVVAAIAVAACSGSSSTGTCCISINGNNQAWTCPTQTAFQACCGGSDESTDGCITDPSGAPQNTCVTVNYATECSG